MQIIRIKWVLRFLKGFGRLNVPNLYIDKNIIVFVSQAITIIDRCH